MSEAEQNEAIPQVEQYGKIEIELTGDPRRDQVEIDGKKLPVQGLWIFSDLDATTVEITAIKLPGDPYTIKGYLISEEDFDWLQARKPMR